MSKPPLNNMAPQLPESGIESAQHELRRLILFVVAMLVFGVGCWLAFPYLTKFTKQWLGHRHLPELRQHIKEQNWPKAAAAMREAKRWAPRPCLKTCRLANGEGCGMVSC